MSGVVALINGVLPQVFYIPQSAGILYHAQRNGKNPESRCIRIAEILKTDSEIRKNPNPAVFAAALATKQGCAIYGDMLHLL